MIFRTRPDSHHNTARSRGQALLEMALVVPLLIILLTGVFEFGLILYAHVQVANAAREAARAASLFRSTRLVVTDNKCVGSMEGWALDQTAQQAIVYRALQGSGAKKDCPDASGTVQATSLGWLDPNVSPAWTVELNGTTLDSNGLPQPGTQATVKVRYPYRLQVIANLFTFFSDPFWIEKSVKFDYQGY
ncbi:MAG TPA: TadE/TadG family type IV pilus assembly protein [Roseiflexaceae bacterium]|nr:TadE/TadG family type IV pilus assembly protein [Roseiflexaceae bacterium]